jgi:CO/xanthine dehydrogenase FAD-binding subunit
MSVVLSDVKFYTPGTLAEALSIRAAERDAVRVVAGGTDVMVWQGAGVPLPPAYLSVWGLRELRGVRRLPGRLEIGALTTYTGLLRDEAVRRHFPALIDASRQVGAAQIQNRGTLGGNVINASPAGDTLPVLAVADAVLVVQSQARGVRRLPFSQFYLGYRKTALEPDELLTHLELPLPPDGARSAFAKVGSRRAQTISKVMAAIQARIDAEGRMVEVALAYGSVAPVIVRMPKTEAALRGERPSVALADRLAPILTAEISPIDDVRSTADYRRFVAAGLLRRFMRGWEG